MARGIYSFVSVVLFIASPQGVLGASASSMTMSISTNPSIFGRTVTLTATVFPSEATGKVTFYDGAAVLGIGAVSNGLASMTTGLLPSGIRSLSSPCLKSGFYGKAALAEFRLHRRRYNEPPAGV